MAEERSGDQSSGATPILGSVEKRGSVTGCSSNTSGQPYHAPGIVVAVDRQVEQMLDRGVLSDAVQAATVVDEDVVVILDGDAQRVVLQARVLVIAVDLRGAATAAGTFQIFTAGCGPLASKPKPEPESSTYRSPFGADPWRLPP